GYLAALRLAAVVVPLGPAYPVARNTLICRSSHVDTIVADDAGGGQVAELAARTGAVPIRLTAGGRVPWHWQLDTPPYPEPYRGQPADVAYTLYTSGSTGEPKGVPIRHRNLADLLRFGIDRYQLGPGSRYAQAFELTFDGSVLPMFLSWCTGATLVVPRSEELLAPSDLVAGGRITHWCSVPSVISIARRQRALPPASMPELRWSSFGGEQLTLAAARAWAAAAPHSAIENVYGPTELTVNCLAYRLPENPAQWPVTDNGTVPIGSAYPHLQAVVLTGDGRPGSEGELCVRGSQRFDGYLDPAHDRDCFVTLDGDRWYRTGDLVRAGPDGALVHLGRLDQQVQIRGYRVELGEIEAVLRSHPEVVDVVVLATGAGTATPTIHAVYTGAPAGLAELAAQRLPPYLRPDHYRPVDSMPVTPGGKVDRRRLAAELGISPAQ
ncbi:MAG: AMP-binding protein, partial [Natronosporangium sp.]